MLFVVAVFWMNSALALEPVNTPTMNPTIEAQSESSRQNSKKWVNAFTTSVSFPQPLMIGIETHRADTPYIAAFYEAGFFKYPITTSTRSVSDYSMEAGIRYHPFHNWFYLVSELGFRHIGINVDISNLKQDGVALANTAQGSIGTFFTGLLAGGQWQLGQSFALAFDLGYQFAIFHTGSITINTDPSQEDGTDYSVDDAREMKRISGLPIPQIALFRLVWYI
jgi:hypothetical protein